MGIITWIVLGLVAGILARLVMPGKQNMNWIMTIVLGVVGALVGGFISRELGWADVSGFNLTSLLIAGGGAVLVLWIYGMLRR